MSTPMISEAVQRSIDRIAIAQQNIKALSIINYRLAGPFPAGRDYSKRLAVAQEVYWAVAYEELSDAWNQLALFAPISKKAMELLEQRSRSLFTERDVALMHFLGYTGSYYTADRDQFERELKEAFGIFEEDNDKTSEDDNT